MAEIRIERGGEAVAQAAAELLIADLHTAAQQNGVATWVAAGGSTPGRAYEVLAQAPDTGLWKQVRVLMGDERCVAPDHEDSNWRQLDARLLSKVAIPRDHLLRPPAELGAETAAERYEATLRRLPAIENGIPRLDHLWLGLGEDGHTLSLFPDHPGLDAGGLVAPVHNSPKPPPDRITLTFAALAGTRNCVILAAGEGKREAVTRALSGDTALPIARAVSVIEGSGGNVVWLLDEAIAPRSGSTPFTS